MNRSIIVALCLLTSACAVPANVPTIRGSLPFCEKNAERAIGEIEGVAAEWGFPVTVSPTMDGENPTQAVIAFVGREPAERAAFLVEFSPGTFIYQVYGEHLGESVPAAVVAEKLVAAHARSNADCVPDSPASGTN